MWRTCRGGKAVHKNKFAAGLKLQVNKDVVEERLNQALHDVKGA